MFWKRNNRKQDGRRPEWIRRGVMPTHPSENGAFTHPLELICSLAFRSESGRVVIGDIENHEELRKAVDNSDVDDNTKKAYHSEINRLYGLSRN